MEDLLLRESPGRASRPRLTQRAREEIWAFLFIAPWAAGFLIFTAGAMLYSLVLAMGKTDLLTGYSLVGMGNYAALLRDEYFWKALRVTVFYALGSVPLHVLLSLFFALLLNQEVPLRGLWRTIYYLPSVVSGVAVSIVWAWMFDFQFGVFNAALSWLGIEGPRWLLSETWALPSLIIMSVWGVGGSLLIYLGGLQSIPTQLHEAAQIDGAGAWSRLFYITLPMLSPTIFFNLVMNLISALQTFTNAYVMTNGGPNNATLTLVLYLYRLSFQQFNFGYASALAWILFVLILLCTLATIRSSEAWVYYEGQVRG